MRVTDIRLGPASSGVTELSALVTGLPEPPGSIRLWFHFPSEFAPGEPLAEPFVAALLPIAMRAGAEIEVDAPVSAQFLRNAGQMSSIWRSWERSFRGTRIRPASVREPKPAATATGCFFTLGADSFYTLRRLIDLGRAPSHLIFIRGYAEMPLDNGALFEETQRHLHEVAGAVGSKLVCATTNLRGLHSYVHPDWDIYAGSMLASAGLCLESQMSRIYVPSGDTFATLSPWGSHPLTDPLWGTERLEFIHHGCEAIRSDKFEHAISRWPLALAHLRVCGSGLGAALNCGSCEKCLRSQIALEACGALSACSTLPALDYERAASINASARAVRFYLRDNLALARRLGGNRRLEFALERSLKPPLLRRASLAGTRAVQRFDQRWLRGSIRRWALSSARNPASEANLKANPGRWLLYRLRGS